MTPSDGWFILPNMLTRLSWANGTETVTHLVSLVDVSANGAAVNMQVIMDVKPVADRPCMIHFENGGVSTGPIPANLVAMETMDSGRTLAKFAFDSVLANRDLIPHQRDAEPGRGWSLARGEPVSPGELEMIPSRCPARCKTSAVEGSPSRPMSPHPGIRPSGSRWDQSVRKPAPPNAGWSGSETINRASSLLALHSSISARCNSTRPPSRFRSECTVPRRLRWGELPRIAGQGRVRPAPGLEHKRGRDEGNRRARRTVEHRTRHRTVAVTASRSIGRTRSRPLSYLAESSERSSKESDALGALGRLQAHEQRNALGWSSRL